VLARRPGLSSLVDIGRPEVMAEFEMVPENKG